MRVCFMRGGWRHRAAAVLAATVLIAVLGDVTGEASGEGGSQSTATSSESQQAQQRGDVEETSTSSAASSEGRRRRFGLQPVASRWSGRQRGGVALEEEEEEEDAGAGELEPAPRPLLAAMRRTRDRSPGGRAPGARITTANTTNARPGAAATILQDQEVLRLAEGGGWGDGAQVIPIFGPAAYPPEEELAQATRDALAVGRYKLDVPGLKASGFKV